MKRLVGTLFFGSVPAGPAEYRESTNRVAPTPTKDAEDATKQRLAHS